MIHLEKLIKDVTSEPSANCRSRGLQRVFYNAIIIAVQW